MTDEAGDAGRAPSLVNAKAACASHLRKTCRTGTVGRFTGTVLLAFAMALATEQL